MNTRLALDWLLLLLVGLATILSDLVIVSSSTKGPTHEVNLERFDGSKELFRVGLVHIMQKKGGKYSVAGDIKYEADVAKKNKKKKKRHKSQGKRRTIVWPVVKAGHFSGSICKG